MPFSSSHPHPLSLPSLEGLWCGGAWGLEWAPGLCKKPIFINFAWGEQDARSGGRRGVGKFGPAWSGASLDAGDFGGCGRGVDWVHWRAGTLESGQGTGLPWGTGRAWAGTARGRGSDLWGGGFRIRGAGQSRVFGPPPICRSSFCCCKGKSGSLWFSILFPPPPPRF